MLPRFRICLEYVDNWVRYSIDGFLLTLPLTLLFRFLERTLYSCRRATIRRLPQLTSTDTSGTSTPSSSSGSSATTTSACSSPEPYDLPMAHEGSQPPSLNPAPPRQEPSPQEAPIIRTLNSPGVSGVPQSWGSPNLGAPGEWARPPPTGLCTPPRWASNPRHSVPHPQMGRFTPRYPRHFYHHPSIPHPSRYRAPVPRPRSQQPWQSPGLRTEADSDPVDILRDCHL